MKIFRILVRLLPIRLKSKLLKKIVENQFNHRLYIGKKHGLNLPLQTLSKFRKKYEVENKKYLRDFELKLMSLLSTENKTEIRKITIVYDNRFSPPTYGDLFHVIMLARLLSTMGAEVYFMLYQGRNRDDWRLLERKARKNFEQEQKELITELFKGNLIFKKNYLKFYLDKRILKIKKKSLIISRYTVALDFISKITNALQLDIPSNFYLTNLEFPVHEVSPYVCMNIRKGLWSKERDTDDALILKDFIAIRKRFPNHKIKILANKHAFQDFYKIMDESSLIKSIAPDWRKYVSAQSKFNFFEAFRLVLSSDFYFQRPNGGMVVAAIYSKIPYLAMTNGYFSFDPVRNKSFPFSSSSQIFIDSNHESDFQENLSTLLSKYQVNLK